MQSFDVALVRRVLRSAVRRSRARFALRGARVLGNNIQVVGEAPRVRSEGTIEIGSRVLFEAPVTAMYLGVERSALLRIGDDCYFNDAISITVTERVSIGSRVHIGPGTRIMDNDFHGVSDRRRPPSKPVEIADDVWIASDCFISPGVRIGRGSVIGAHSVVTRDVPDYAVMAGTPAKQINTVDAAMLEASQAADRAGYRHGLMLPSVASAEH